MHVLTAAAHKHLAALFEAGGAVNFRNALAALAGSERYLACELEGRRYDFGVKYGLLNAQLALSLAGTDRDEVLRNMMELLATKGR